MFGKSKLNGSRERDLKPSASFLVVAFNGLKKRRHHVY